MPPEQQQEELRSNMSDWKRSLIITYWQNEPFGGQNTAFLVTYCPREVCPCSLPSWRWRPWSLWPEWRQSTRSEAPAWEWEPLLVAPSAPWSSSSGTLPQTTWPAWWSSELYPPACGWGGRGGGRGGSAIRSEVSFFLSPFFFKFVRLDNYIKCLLLFFCNMYSKKNKQKKHLHLTWLLNQNLNWHTELSIMWNQ